MARAAPALLAGDFNMLPGSPEHGRMLAPFGDADTFVAAATALARDPDALRRMGQTARQDILRLDSERVYDRLETLFLDAIPGGAPCTNPC